MKESDAALRGRIAVKYGMWGAFMSAVIEASGEALDELAASEGLVRLDVSERRTIDRTPCCAGGCPLPRDHAGAHRGTCGCASGCQALGCPNA